MNTLRAARVEDIEWLIAAGEHPDRIATRIGYANLENLTVQLCRWGRRDLVTRLRSARDAA